MVQTTENTATQELARPEVQTKERKIGTTTFIVSSSFSEGKKRDVVSVIARLIAADAAYDADSGKENLTKTG